MESWSLAVVAVRDRLRGGLAAARAPVISAAMVFVAAGLLAGPEVLGWIDLESRAKAYVCSPRRR